MLTLTVHNLGDMVILRCTGRIVRGEETAILCAAAQQQGRNVILDLSGVDAIDAAGIGLLVSLQAAGILSQANESDQASARDIASHQPGVRLRDLRISIA